MEQNLNSNRVIAKNTLMLYLRQILIMLVSLYTIRVILNVLGAEDYGIYNVVAGTVTMFSFLSNSMATASQRYFSFELGKKNSSGLKIIFSVTYEIYLLLSLLIIILAETIGLWFVNNKLVIPSVRLFSANIVYQAAIISFIFTLITTPYMASLIAHENMKVYAYVSIIEALLKLSIVFILKFIAFDKLISYGILLTVVTVINSTIYRIFCKKNYAECRFSFVKNKNLFIELISYCSWNLFGSFASVCKGQITNIVLNMFFGPIVNAARGVASQVNGAINSFAQNFNTAMRPQVVKKYAVNQKEDCFELVNWGSKITFFLMYIFSLPLFFEMDYVLKIWLKTPPVDAVLFTRLALIETLIDTLSYQIMALSQASGKIKLYQGVVGGLLLLNLPVSYLILKLGAPAYAVCIVSISIAALAIYLRLIIVHILTGFSVISFFKKVMLPCLSVVFLTCFPAFFITKFLCSSLIRFFITVLVSVTLVCLAVLFLGLNKSERVSLYAFMKNKIKK